MLALDGKGGARLHADLAEWERAREDASESAATQKKEAAKRAAEEAPPPPGLKRLTYMEQREWEQMEAKILEAEEDLHARQKLLDDPAVQSDHVKMATCCREYEAAQDRVQTLYGRWGELEAKQTG